MCVLALALQHHPATWLAFAGNRDEFLDRPSAPADWWQAHPDVLGGRDLVAGGSWLGISRSGRFAVVTNYRERATTRPGTRSRGSLVAGFLVSDKPPAAFAAALEPDAHLYAGFSLLIGEFGRDVWYCSNRAAPVRLEPGVHGLSNGGLNAAWPKVDRLREVIGGPGFADDTAVLATLTDTSRAHDDRLPDTGVGIARERALSPLFVRLPGYGTRCSTLIRISDEGSVCFAEHTWDASGQAAGQRHYTFDLRVTGEPA